MSPELKKIKEFTADEIRRTIAKYMRLSKGELNRIIKEESDKLPMFEALVCSILANAMKSGDYSKLDFLLNRSGHKLKDESKVDVTTHSEVEERKQQVLNRMSTAEVVQMLKKPALTG